MNFLQNIALCCRNCLLFRQTLMSILTVEKEPFLCLRNMETSTGGMHHHIKKLQSKFSAMYKIMFFLLTKLMLFTFSNECLWGLNQRSAPYEENDIVFRRKWIFWFIKLKHVNTLLCHNNISFTNIWLRFRPCWNYEALI